MRRDEHERVIAQPRYLRALRKTAYERAAVSLREIPEEFRRFAVKILRIAPFPLKAAVPRLKEFGQGDDVSALLACPLDKRGCRTEIGLY